MHLEKYKNLSGKGGVTAFKILDKEIILQFENENLYSYDYISPGKEHVKELITLARKGKGLTTYINKNIRNNYRKKITK